MYAGVDPLTGRELRAGGVPADEATAKRILNRLTAKVGGQEHARRECGEASLPGVSGVPASVGAMNRELEPAGRVLRDYLYVDVDKVKSIAGQLESGVPEETRLTTKDAKRTTMGWRTFLSYSPESSEEGNIQRSMLDSLFPDREDILEQGWLEERVGVRRTPRDASNLGAAIQTYMRAHVLATRSEMAAVLGVDRTLVSRVGACGCAGLATL